jgi:lysophospholipid acyltransferase (LPLAT)-like uncharacterized protein
MIRRLLPLASSLLAGTLRIQRVGDGIAERSVIMFWHGKMFAGWYSVRKRRPIALVSRSKDGEILGRVLAHWGYKLARGSSKKAGREALDVVMEAIRSGEANTLVITPDGPTGPQHSFKRGAFIAAKELGMPLYMLRVEYGKRSVLKSWDKFEVPWPFSRVRIAVEEIDLTSFPAWDADLQRAWLDTASLRFDD